jgi:NADPH:quinone reductase-like Zn-dependent oxidoreductase
MNMKAILFPTYGSPDVLQLQTVRQPMPQEDEVLVKVIAAAANPLDWHRLRADPFLVRLADGLLRPKDPRLGADMAGRITAVGGRVSEFKVGDEVFGEIGRGAFADYVCVKEKSLAHKPANISFAQAAAVPVAGFTALQGLRDSGQIRQGQKVLVNGASGGVGTFAVQMAKAFGAEVTAVCSTRNLELVRTIGADHAIDYTQQDFTRTGQQYDLIYDAIGNRTVGDLKRALTPKGICTVAGFTTIPHMLRLALQGLWVTKTSEQQIGMMGTAIPNKQDLLVLKELLETGKIVPVIDRHYPLAQTAEAIRYLETGRARGKVIINIA